jgi:thymidylate synthase ThyX
MIIVNGANGISATVLLDSISESGKRMTTFELEYPRIIHGEFMTHRALSKNAASSRAIPINAAIEHAINKPAFPVYWGKAQRGMQAEEQLTGYDLELAKKLWQKGINQNIELVKEFDAIHAHKQIASRWLETGQLFKVIASGTDYDNFFWLRNDKAAQPEFRELARVMKECLDLSVPNLLFYGEWHLPFITTKRLKSGVLIYLDSNSEQLELEDAKKISTSCSAQISYRKLDDTKEKALDLYSRLFSGEKKHMSPTEHQATPIKSISSVNVLFDFSTWENGVTHIDRNGVLHSGNLSGWIQYRQTLPNNVYV